MSRPILQRLCLVLVLSLLTIPAFLIRLQNFKNTTSRTIDEIVYYRMGRQVLHEGLAGYNTIPYARELTAQGRPLPDYFFQPVYKYPPLFTLMIAQSMRMFSETLLAAAYVPLLAGVLLIPLTYLLGMLVANRFVGVLAAFLTFTDPVATICSQKVWPETALTFFTLVSIVSFVLALKEERNIFFIFSGIFCGLATGTKYPGILLVGAYGLYAVIRNRDLLIRPSFYIGVIALPFLMHIPWLLWNIEVYGWRWFIMQIGLHSSFPHQEELLAKTALSFLLFGIGIFWLFLRGGKTRIQAYLMQCRQRAPCLIPVLAGIIFIVLFWDNLRRALNFTTLPSAGWSSGMFYYATPLFYLGRLLEFSLIYGFAYVAFFFIPSPVPGNELPALKITTLVLLFFYIFWGNYQSRYILACIPLLLVLATHMINLTIVKIIHQPSPLRRNVLLLSLFLIILYAVIKTSYINAALSFPNDVCYF